MVWRRDDDQYRQRTCWDYISYESRWLMDCLIEECCRAEQWDGLLTMKRAARLSDVDDPVGCLHQLADAGLVEQLDVDGVQLVRVLHIDEHIPPEEIRLAKQRKQTAERMRRLRRRRCDAGDHSPDCPKGCPVRVKSDRANGSEPAESPVPMSLVTEGFPVPVPVPVPVPDVTRHVRVTEKGGDGL